MFTNGEIKNLTIKLAKAEKEEHVEQILSKYGLLSDVFWRPFGDNENNFSVIGAQQSSPDAALVEKLINSVDAVLIRKSFEGGINPESVKAPANIPQALEEFFQIPEGKLSNLTDKERTQLSNNIQLIVSGRKTAPNYCIVDKGEGQTPNRLPHTILSLSKSNKLRIPFVQGKFNMGGTGVFQFCGDQNYQLVISKRCPTIPEQFNNYDGHLDTSKDKWGVTIVRRNNPDHSAKSSQYQYLAPNNYILRFQTNELPILPQNRSLEWGTFMKLYNYKIGSLKTLATLNLNYALSVLMPSVALPIRIIETRDYNAHSLEATLSGLSVRLQEDKNKNLEKGFPYESELVVDDHKIKYSINVFKEGKDDNYRNKNEGVILVVNGQTHGYLPKTIYSKKKVGLGYLANSIITILDCSKLSLRAREDLFMNSRDKLRNVELKKKLEDNLEDLFKNDPILNRLQKERRQKALQDQIGNSKPMSEVLSNIIKTNPTIKNLLLGGTNIINPYDSSSNQTESRNDTFKGLSFPTHFTMLRQDDPKLVPKNRRARVKFSTDVENNYFGRKNDPGILCLTVNGKSVSDYSVNLINGRCTINIKLPQNCKVNDLLDYKVEVTDPTQPTPFVTEFQIKVGVKVTKNTGGTSKQSNKNKRLAPPNVNEITEDQWGRYNMDKNGALRVYDGGDGIYDFFVNVDNQHLLAEVSTINDDEQMELIKSQYKLGIVLVGLSTIQHFLERESDEETDEIDISQAVYENTKIISPILLPMTKSMAELNLDDYKVT